MAITLGELNLVVGDSGSDALLGKLAKIDQSSKAVDESRLKRSEILSAAAKFDAQFGTEAQKKLAAATTQTTQAVERQTVAHQRSSRAATDGATRVAAGGRQAFTAIQAVSFGLSQMAATGETSFRTLSSGLGSFLAFMGPQGAVASIALTTGLALTDFFTRTQRQLEETAQKAIDEAKRASREITIAMREGDAVGLVARAKGLQTGTADRPGLADLEKERRQLDDDISGQRLLISTFGLQKSEQENAVMQKTLERLEARRNALQGQIDALRREQATILNAVLGVPDARAPRGAISTTGQRPGPRQIPTLGKGPLADSVLQFDVPQLAQRIKIPPGAAAELLAHPLSDAAKEMQKAEQGFQDTLAEGLAGAISGGLASGFAEGLASGGVGEGFKQLTNQMLAGFGSLFLQVGEKAILGSSLLQSLAKGLASLNPAVAIGAGVALLALARAMGAHGGNASRAGLGGGFSASAGDNAAIRALITDPNLGRLQNARAASPANPFAGVTFITTESAAGQRIIGTTALKFAEKGGRR